MLMTPTSPICNPIVVEKLPSCLVGLLSLTRTSWNTFGWLFWQLYQLSTHLDDNYDNFPLSNQTDRMSHSLIVWSLLLLIRCLPSPFGSRNAIPSTWPENWKLQNTILSIWLVCKKEKETRHVTFMNLPKECWPISVKSMWSHIRTCQNSNRLGVIFPQSPPVPHLKYDR